MSVSEIVHLNVGGTKYITTKSTLCKYPESMLGAMFMENVPLSTDKNGYYFIDRCGHIFQYILQFLRCGKLVLPQGFNELELLKVEADFYQIEGLISAVSAVEHHKTKVEVKEWDETPVLLFSILHYQNIIRSIKDMKLFIKSRGIGFELIDCKLDINNRDENGVRTYLQSDGWVLKEQKTLEKIEASVFFVTRGIDKKFLDQTESFYSCCGVNVETWLRNPDIGF